MVLEGASDTRACKCCNLLWQAATDYTQMPRTNSAASWNTCFLSRVQEDEEEEVQLKCVAGLGISIVTTASAPIDILTAVIEKVE